jgi:hypothetical protein
VITPALYRTAFDAVRCKCVAIGVVGVALAGREAGHGVLVGGVAIGIFAGAAEDHAQRHGRGGRAPTMAN